MTKSDGKITHLPKHVAIIMDGNGRWAKKRNLSRQLGHRQGAKVTEEIIRHAHKRGIKYLTVYAFSSENWQRPKAESDALMEIFQEFLAKDPSELIENGIKISAIGDLLRLPPSLRQALNSLIEKTKNGKNLCLTLALSYGSWDEVSAACRDIAQQVQNSSLKIEDIDALVVKKNLQTQLLPDPDLFIRTSGEKRLSNFLLMQISYSELYFCDTLWPDFKCYDFDEALADYARRMRRFGKTDAD